LNRPELQEKKRINHLTFKQNQRNWFWGGTSHTSTCGLHEGGKHHFSFSFEKKKEIALEWREEKQEGFTASDKSQKGMRKLLKEAYLKKWEG